MQKLCKIVKFVLRPIYTSLLRVIRQSRFRAETRVLRKRQNDTPKSVFFLIGSPTHGNLGDHAISLAELDFLNDYFPGTPIVELFGSHFRGDTKNIVPLVQKKDIILITGGGFLGNLWMLEEELVRNVIEQFPNNRIVILPQTIFFAKGSYREKELLTTKRIYQAHHDLHILVRETASQKFIENNMIGGHFRDCALGPDIVTYMNKSDSRFEREGALLCLRKDKESLLCDNDKQTIHEYVKSVLRKVVTIDTVLPRSIKKSQRVRRLEEKLDEFRRSKLVITDRLHGMLFAAITGTPCIALGNSSGKVKGVYNWLTHLDYIQYIDSTDEIPKHLHRLSSLGSCKYDNRCLQVHFRKIAQTIIGQ